MIQYIHTIINIALSVAFAASFIGFFFFTYAKNIERQIVINNVEFTINDLFDNIVSILPESLKGIIKEQISSIKLADMTKVDKEVAVQNHELLLSSAKVLGGLLIVVLIGTYWLASMYELNYHEIISQSILLLCCIAFVEYVFLTFIIQKYISANPNIVKYNLVKIF